MREVKLPSGATLKVNAAPFTDAKALYQAVLEEAKGVKFDSNADIAGVYKDVFCATFSSKKIDAAMKECLKRCQYCDKRGELKVDDDTFEPEEARQDYMVVLTEVAKENLGPFVKSLYADFKKSLEMVDISHA